ncbi:S1/P1 nuclease [Imperialibacter roseus]|uniref:S1/P1 nuclease n=1 Tax=Imperialibacter roseus TaxID=1324217 RepID=A0ABZ0IMF2_9BACT|nr:S1/P1 nuclease [Imperialibacter roseus]WOK06213.1 S1/P1 nuclease [Imperialibacter roseus]
MKRIMLPLTVLLMLTFSAQAVNTTSNVLWGQTGHRVVGLVAERHLTKKAKANIGKILGGESLAIVSNYMDFIKSDPTYKHMDPWHYCTIPDGQAYEQAGTPSEGDVIATIERLKSELKSKQFTDRDEAFAIKMLAHLVGDIHQPLHVGNGNDRGGNDVKLKYFWESSNLHRVWDSDMIDGQQLSYTEFADWVDTEDKATVAAWQKNVTTDWAYESMGLREQVYNLPEDLSLSYRYNFDNIDAVKLRLVQAGVRLAGLLNEIYG